MVPVYPASRTWTRQQHPRQGSCPHSPFAQHASQCDSPAGNQFQTTFQQVCRRQTNGIGCLAGHSPLFPSNGLPWASMALLYQSQNIIRDSSMLIIRCSAGGGEVVSLKHINRQHTPPRVVHLRTGTPFAGEYIVLYNEDVPDVVVAAQG